MHPVRFGIGLWQERTAWAPLLETVQLVDRLGYDSLWAEDHLYADPPAVHGPIFEAWTLLGAWAMATARVRLGLLVGGNSLRHPGVVAKSAVTLDHISGGRAILGVGAGWMAEEHQAFGLPFGAGAGERLDWLDEALSIVRPLLAGETVTHHGPHYQVEELTLLPRPLQNRLPILVGGRGERKTLRTVARSADLWHVPRPNTVEGFRRLNEILEAHGQAAGRDTAVIERAFCPLVVIRDDSAAARRAYAAMLAAHGKDPADALMGEDAWFGPPRLIAERIMPFLELGFRHVIVDLFAPYDRETIERFIGEVKPLLVS